MFSRWNENDTCAARDWLKECRAIEAEGERPYLRWAGAHNVTVCVGDTELVTTTYQRARELIEPEAA